MNPLVYDFRRTFVRFSTIFFIVIFAIAGVGLSYLVYSVTIQPYKSEFVNINDVATVLNNGNGNYTVLVYVFGNLGNPIPNARVEISGNSGVYSSSTNSSGYAVFTIPLNISTSASDMIQVTYEGKSVNETFAGQGVFYYASQFVGGAGSSSQYTIPEGNAIVSSHSSAPPSLAYVITSSNNGKAILVIGTTEKNVVASYTFLRSTSSFSIPFSGSQSQLTLNNYINVFSIQVPDQTEYFMLQAPVHNLPGYYVTGSIYYPQPRGLVNVVSSIQINAGIFTLALPILMFYLAYSILAKPRDSGALLFLLSKPVTRRQIYLNRLLAGSITAIIASFIYSVLTYGVIDYLMVSSTGVSVPLDVFVLSFVSVAVELIAFYSLVLMLPTFIKSAGLNLGLSIFLYLLFAIFWNVVAVVIAGITGNFTNIGAITYKIDYFNPIGVGSLVDYFVQREYSIVSSYSFISAPLVALAALVWIIVPAIIGMWRIRKIDI